MQGKNVKILIILFIIRHHRSGTSHWRKCGVVSWTWQRDLAL